MKMSGAPTAANTATSPLHQPRLDNLLHGCIRPNAFLVDPKRKQGGGSEFKTELNVDKIEPTTTAAKNL